MAVVAHAGARTHAGISDLCVARPAVAYSFHEFGAPCVRARGAAALSRKAAMVLGQARNPGGSHASPIWRACPAGERAILLCEIETADQIRHGALAAAARGDVGRRAGAGVAEPARAGACAPRAPGRPSDRRLRSAGFRPSDGRRLLARCASGCRCRSGEIRFEPP